MNNVYQSSVLRKYVPGILLGCVLIVYYWSTMPLLGLNGGSGWDGVYYGQMASDFPSAIKSGIPAPFNRRVLPSILVWVLQAEPAFGFRILNTVCYLGSVLVLCWLLGQYQITPHVVALCIWIYSLSPFGLRMSLFYPVLTDTMGQLFGLLILAFAFSKSFYLLLVSCLLSIFVRENLLVLLIVPFIKGMREKDAASLKPLAYISICCSVVAVYYWTYPLVKPIGSYSYFAGVVQMSHQIFHVGRMAIVFPAIGNALGLGTLGLLIVIVERRFHLIHSEWIGYCGVGAALAAVGGSDVDRLMYNLVGAGMLVLFAVVVDRSRITWKESASLWLLSFLTANAYSTWSPDPDIFLNRQFAYATPLNYQYLLIRVWVPILTASFILVNRYIRQLSPNTELKS
jgi:hypothetical protein